jgi:prevent-host-death family protein
MIRFVNVRELKNRTSAVLRKSRQGDVVVTSRGKPAVVVHAITEASLEDYLLAHSAQMQQSAARAYQEYQRKGGIPIERLLADTERELAKVRR